MRKGNLRLFGPPQMHFKVSLFKKLQFHGIRTLSQGLCAGGYWGSALEEKGFWKRCSNAQRIHN